ncbi:unnamed protein product [marine sediment metagenome]|uniref:Uncharacterized protein n=1 Tax=marine sediment metagenome TaxID=412755 RepID=X1IW69_9ZZZZ
MTLWRPWPYAATAIVQWEWVGTSLYLWVTFKYPMDQTITPDRFKFKCRVNDVMKPPLIISWVDEFTFKGTLSNIPVLPDRVTLEYEGPDPTLRTTWDKQWEPWGEILGYRAMGSPWSGTKTHSALGPTDNVDVADIGILFIDCSANDITIGGFVGGINGQVLRVVKLCEAAFDLTLEHNEGTGNQDIFLHRGEDETLTGEYGGWTLVCNGSNWFGVSHAKHV